MSDLEANLKKRGKNSLGVWINLGRIVLKRDMRNWKWQFRNGNCGSRSSSSHCNRSLALVRVRAVTAMSGNIRLKPSWNKLKLAIFWFPVYGIQRGSLRMLSLSRGGFLLWRFSINAAEARKKKTEIRNFIGGIRCRASNMLFSTILCHHICIIVESE